MYTKDYYNMFDADLRYDKNKGLVARKLIRKFNIDLIQDKFIRMKNKDGKLGLK